MRERNAALKRIFGRQSHQDEEQSDEKNYNTVAVSRETKTTTDKSLNSAVVPIRDSTTSASFQDVDYAQDEEIVEPEQLSMGVGGAFACTDTCLDKGAKTLAKIIAHRWKD